jgi:prolyl-tRNA editing enzyme YbaK/EbsC (Cys-tRNA(Pro) deacylase)
VKQSVRRVVDALAAAGVDAEVKELAQSTRTAEEAAAAIGTSVPCIVKSLVFLADGEPVLALVSGSNRLDTARVSEALGRMIERADAAKVREATGFAIGGVAPVGHTGPLEVLVDRDLLQYDQVWAAAGTPNAVFPIAPPVLVQITSGRVLDLKEVESGQAPATR